MMQLGGNLAESGQIKFCIHINIYTQMHILYTLPEYQSKVWKTICIRKISEGPCDTDVLKIHHTLKYCILK